METANARRMLGERLTAYRKMAGLSVAQLAARVQTPRQYIYDIEAGRVNFTIDQFSKLLTGCGASFEELLAGTNVSAIPLAFQDLVQMLTTILKAGNRDLIHGVRVSLDAIADKAARLMKARASPSPKSGLKQEAQRAAQSAGSIPHKQKRRTSG